MVVLAWFLMLSSTTCCGLPGDLVEFALDALSEDPLHDFGVWALDSVVRKPTLPLLVGVLIHD